MYTFIFYGRPSISTIAFDGLVANREMQYKGDSKVKKATHGRSLQSYCSYLRLAKTNYHNKSQNSVDKIVCADKLLLQTSTYWQITVLGKRLSVVESEIFKPSKGSKTRCRRKAKTIR